MFATIASCRQTLIVFPRIITPPLTGSLVLSRSCRALPELSRPSRTSLLYPTVLCCTVRAPESRALGLELLELKCGSCKKKSFCSAFARLAPLSANFDGD